MIDSTRTLPPSMNHGACWALCRAFLFSRVRLYPEDEHGQSMSDNPTAVCSQQVASVGDGTAEISVCVCFGGVGGLG